MLAKRHLPERLAGMRAEDEQIRPPGERGAGDRMREIAAVPGRLQHDGIAGVWGRSGMRVEHDSRDPDIVAAVHDASDFVYRRRRRVAVVARNEKAVSGNAVAAWRGVRQRQYR